MALLGQVEQPARGAHDDVGARSAATRSAARRAVRRRWRPATASGLRRGTSRRRSGPRRPGCTARGWAPRSARAGVPSAVGSPVGRGDAVQQRHAEGEGLAHAGAGLADEVAAVQGQREGRAWMGNARSMPSAASAATIRGTVPSSAKAGAARGGGRRTTRSGRRHSGRSGPRAHAPGSRCARTGTRAGGGHRRREPGSEKPGRGRRRGHRVGAHAPVDHGRDRH